MRGKHRARRGYRHHTPTGGNLGRSYPMDCLSGSRSRNKAILRRCDWVALSLRERAGQICVYRRRLSVLPRLPPFVFSRLSRPNACVCAVEIWFGVVEFGRALLCRCATGVRLACHSLSAGFLGPVRSPRRSNHPRKQRPPPQTQSARWRSAGRAPCP